MKKIKRITFGALAMLMAFSVVGCDNGIGENSGGYDGGYDDGYQAGLAAGKENGYGDGYQAGYDEAFNKDYWQDGYDKGYQDGFAAGGGSGDVEEEIVGETDYSKVDPGTGKIVLYLDESHVYGAYREGSDEGYVEEQIAAKFKQDTGLDIDFEIMYKTHDNFTSSFKPIMATDEWDAAVGYIGQAGLNETVLTSDVTLDLSNYIENFYNIRREVGTKALYSTTLVTDEIIGIPSVNKTKMKSILVRKDYMRQVGYTESKEEADASNGTLKHCNTILDFDDMLRKMKAQIPKCTIPLMGKPYDIEFTVLAGACGTTGYQYSSINYNPDGSVKEVVPGWLAEGYQDVLNWEYKWQTEALWDVDQDSKSETQSISDFVAGKGGVYCISPSITNLIDVARQVKRVDQKAEFTILDPLDAVDDNGNAIEGSGAFAEVSRTTDCLIINKESENAELLLAYLDWMYSSVENYELCAYGVEGEHWEKDGDGFYKYPADYKEIYEAHAPYSGAFALLHNDEFAFRRYANYKEYELEWIERVESAKTMANPTDGMLMYNMPNRMAQNLSDAESKMHELCATKAWNGSSDPKTTYPSMAAAYKSQTNYTSKDDQENYILWLTNQYKLYKMVRK